MNVLSDDFLSNGEFQKLYSTFDNSDEICLWGNQVADYDQNFVYSENQLQNSEYQKNEIYQTSNYINSNNFDDFLADNHHSEFLSNYYSRDEEYDQITYNNDFTEMSTENFLIDMDEWKQNHLNELMYQANNNNDWESNLENLLFDGSCDAFSYTLNLPARTFIVMIRVQVLLKKHLNIYKHIVLH